MKHFLIAPNAFKHSLSAPEAAKAIEKGLLNSKLSCQTTKFPIGDGGNGTCQLLHEHLKGKWVDQTVTGPLGELTKAGFSLINNDKTAVIEMADAAGIHLIKTGDRNPLETTSKGVGELIKAALDYDVKTIVLGLGGSATVDGGCGILHALGVRFLAEDGNELEPVPRALAHLESIDDSPIDKRLENMNITILCDVKNNLLGQNGAARVFGPQKGASSENVTFLEKVLRKFAAKIRDQQQIDIAALTSGGAAGGAAAGLKAFTRANLVNGITEFLRLTNFEASLKNTDYLITGEGSLDEQTLSGKGPYGVAQMAKSNHIPCVGMAGQVPLNPSSALKDLFPVLWPINPNLSEQNALSSTATNLERTAEFLGNSMAI